MIYTTLLALASIAAQDPDDPAPRPVRPRGESATAVVVPAALPLVFSGQALPVDREGRVVAPGDDRAQAEAVLDRLEGAIRGAGGRLDALVRVHVVGSDVAAISAFRQALSARLARRRGSQPTLTLAEGNPPIAGARVAADLVAAGVAGARGAPRVLMGSGVSAAVLPPGRRVFVSGQADPGTDLAEATRKTLAGLDETLKFLGIDRSRVVQAKAFLTPVADAEAARREIAAFFGESAPPAVFVEWSSTLPIEIELVAWGGPPEADAPAIEYLTPPALKASPVFSRVARVNGGDLIFVSGLYGPLDADAPKQAGAVFEALAGVLKECGGDLRHLAKATYYVTDDAASRALNDIRPTLYDPARPPAASKATVRGVGAVGRTLTLDMIGVPAPPR